MPWPNSARTCSPSSSRTSTRSSPTSLCPSLRAPPATSPPAGSARFGAGPTTADRFPGRTLLVTVNVGVIGVGMIGQDHIRRLTTVLSGARVTAVTDADLDRAQAVADGLSAKLHKTGQDLIEDPDVDAVVVASWGPTHEEFVLAGIAAGKQVFCEKPLATTREACERIIDAEVAAGRRQVMVGFMRRYDDAYRAMKNALTGGAIGAPLIYYSGHRNPSVL